MKIRICYLAIAVTALFACAAVAPAAPPKKSSAKPKVARTKSKSKTKIAKKKSVGQPSNAEVGLVGIKLYDTGLKLISKYGSPTDIVAVNIGSTTTGIGGGGGTGTGPGPMGPMGGRGGAPSVGGGPGMVPAPALSASPNSISDLDETSFVLGPPAGGMSGASLGGSSGPPSGSGAGPMGPGSMGGAAMGGGAGQAGSRTVFTRWIYRHGGSRYAFILDKFNRVVEIEAIGMVDSKVRTKKGIGFGASVGTVIRKYGAPDAYEISGNSIIIRYLVRNKVAFRLSRLGVDKPHVVTGVVIAAGKS